MRRRLKRFFTWLNIFVIGLTFLSYYANDVSPQSFWPITLLGTAFPWLLFLNLVCIAFWIFLRKWHFMISAFTLILGWSHVSSFIGMHPFASAGEKSKNQLKVMSFNAGAFYFLYKQNPEKVARPFFEFLKKENPDIACFQEFTYRGTNFENRMDSLRNWAGFKYFKGSENKQILIASKYPFENSGYLKFERTHNGAVFADIKWNGKTFRVYNLHLESNQITPQAEKLAESGDLQEKETWLEIGSILKKNKEASKKRASQAEEIRTHMEKSPHPLLVCGDFNDTPSSYVYGILSDGLHDGFRESGFGIGTTYAGKIPALRIDYILSGLDMEFKKSKVHRMGFSDHYPVTATLETKSD